MTVGELKEVLDDYGDHVELAIVVTRGNEVRSFPLEDAPMTMDSENRFVLAELDW